MNKLLTGILVASAIAVGRPAAAAPPQQQSFSVTFDLATPDEPGVVYAEGPITGVGTVIASERDTGNAFHETETFVFGGGTLAVRANDVNTSVMFDPASCTVVYTFKGNFSITGGTGDFAAARGHGHFAGRSTINFTPDPNSAEGCDFDHMSGTIHGEALGKVQL